MSDSDADFLRGMAEQLMGSQTGEHRLLEIAARLERLEEACMTALELSYPTLSSRTAAQTLESIERLLVEALAAAPADKGQG